MLDEYSSRVFFSLPEEIVNASQQKRMDDDRMSVQLYFFREYIFDGNTYAHMYELSENYHGYIRFH